MQFAPSLEALLPGKYNIDDTKYNTNEANRGIVDKCSLLNGMPIFTLSLCAILHFLTVLY